MNFRERIIFGESGTLDYTDAWLEYLESVDCEHPLLDQLRSLRGEIERLEVVATDIANTSPVTAPPIRELGSVQTAADVLKAVVRSDGPNQDEIDAAARAVRERIVNTTRHYTGGFRRFVRNDLLAELTPYHDSLVVRAIELGGPMPDGLSRDEDARLGGVAAAWRELGSVLTEIDELRRVVAHLRSVGSLPNSGARNVEHYDPTEFSYRDPERALIPLAWNTRVGFVRALESGQPALLHVEEIDALRKRAPERPARDDASHYARVRRQMEIDAWTGPARTREEQQRMRDHEETLAARSRARMASPRRV